MTMEETDKLDDASCTLEQASCLLEAVSAQSDDGKLVAQLAGITALIEKARDAFR